jgi:protein gp37
MKIDRSFKPHVGLVTGERVMTKKMFLKNEKAYREQTWNPVVGCSRVSMGCDPCYAIHECQRMSGNPAITKKHGVNPYLELVQIKNGKLDFSGKLHFFEDRLDVPLHVKRPTIWFVNSLSDMYHGGVSLDVLKRIFDVMNRADWHIFDILTKRADRMAELSGEFTWTPNIWQGVTFEGIPANMADGQRKAILSRISALREHPANVKFVSFEPLIGAIPSDLDLTGIDWAFFGGESHRTILQARPMELQWLRDGIALCESHGCKPYIKQLGTAWAAATGNWRHKDKVGKDSLPWPEDLRPYAIHSLREITPHDLGSTVTVKKPKS